ncbi:MAG TPA: IPT/TIG domain-containing protein [Solirubrobacteraceae bacterium]
MGCPNGGTLAQIVDPEALYEAPASGTITSWRVTGTTGLKLRVFHEGPEAEWITAGSSAAATNGKGEANATSLPIRAGDVIGVGQPSGSDSEVGFRKVTPQTALVFSWGGLGEDVVAPPEPLEGLEEVLLVNADVVLAPVVSSLSPASGGTAGGTAVTITGKYLDGATGVTFGATPASTFGVDSPSQITAIAPVGAAGTVDVHVTGPGGLSGVGPADRYTYNAPPASTSSPTLSNPLPLAPVAKLAVSGFSQSAARWKRGGALPRMSSTPLGTTFSFTLNEPAAAGLAFTRRVAGRRVGGRCVAVTGRNAHKAKCTRAVAAGTLPLAAHAGLNKVRFQGRLTGVKSLPAGTYAVALTASDASGVRSSPQSLSFTIVAG